MALATALERLAAEAAATSHCPSVAWGVVVDGRLAITGSTGTVGDGVEPSADTVYRIASMTKSFTAAAVLALRDDGLLSLDDPVARLAPELGPIVGPTSDAPPVRVRHLLSMASGLATDDAWADRHLDIDAGGLDGLIATGARFAVATGTAFEYSNLGYGLIGRIVERVTGTRLQQVVTERLLEPLGLERTTWTRPAHSDQAAPHRTEGTGAVADGQEPLGDGAIAPMGGLWSTVADLARWVAWLDDATPPRDGTDAGPLRRSSRREMQEIHRYAGIKRVAGLDAPTGYGFGLMVRDDPRLGRVVSHSGGLPGYGSNMRWLAGRRVAAIALGNVTYAPMGELTMRMLGAAADHDPNLLEPLEVEAPLVHELAARLVALLGSWTDEAARALFADNVEPDESFARRAEAAARFVADCGGVLHVRSVVATTAAAGRITIARPAAPPAVVRFELAPLPAPLVQLYEIELPPG